MRKWCDIAPNFYRPGERYKIRKQAIVSEIQYPHSVYTLYSHSITLFIKIAAYKIVIGAKQSDTRYRGKETVRAKYAVHTAPAYNGVAVTK